MKTLQFYVFYDDDELDILTIVPGLLPPMGWLPKILTGFGHTTGRYHDSLTDAIGAAA